MASIVDRSGVSPAGAGWGWIVAFGVVSVLLGLFAFAQPFAATLAATVVAGIFFIMAGVVSLLAAFGGRGHEARGYRILFGIISLIAGASVLLFPAGGALSLTLIVAVWLAVRGVSELIFAFRHRFHRAWMLILGVVNLGLAIYVWALLPISALAVPGFVLGISFLLGGINALVSGLAHRRGAPAFATPA